MRLKALFIAFLAAFCALPARAEDYPARALHIITANSVGGTSDIFVRALWPTSFSSDWASRSLSRTVRVAT
jgi:tripartite-type tricarboxylate transporter receptor subunit TctC